MFLFCFFFSLVDDQQTSKNSAQIKERPSHPPNKQKTKPFKRNVSELNETLRSSINPRAHEMHAPDVDRVVCSA